MESNFKNELIENVKKMSNRDCKKNYGLLFENDINHSLFSSFDEIPIDHKIALQQGIKDLKNGKNENLSHFIKQQKANKNW